jgi:hypothetical protein
MGNPVERDIVKRILLDLSDRSGLGDQWDQIDADIKTEIHGVWEKLTRAEIDKEPNRSVDRAVVESILKDMTNRRGLRQEWDQFDDGVKTELRVTWKKIVREALNPSD